MTDSRPDSLPPLPTAVFHILIALADRDRHGYSVMQDVAARTGGRVQLSAAAAEVERLNTLVQQARATGLVRGTRCAPKGSTS